MAGYARNRSGGVTARDDADAFPVYDVGEGPDPIVRVSRGIGFWIGEGDGAVRLRPTMMVVRGLVINEPDHDDED